MNRSDLVTLLASKNRQLSEKDVDLSVRLVLDAIARALAKGGRVEIRGFGAFSVRYRAARTGRNPMTGKKVSVREKYIPHFKPGKELRERVAKANR